MVPGDSMILAIGQKYNSRNFLSLIATEGAGITKSGTTYLSNYSDHFSNVSIIPVARP